MKLQFFEIPARVDAVAVDELNGFLAQHRIRDVERQFVDAGDRSFWSVCVTYVEGARSAPPASGRRPQVDYREILPPAEFKVYARLRELRKELAARDGVPAYHVLTNEQLAVLVRRRVLTHRDLEAVEGIGPARLKKYGGPLLEALGELIPGLVGETDARDPCDPPAS